MKPEIRTKLESMRAEYEKLSREEIANLGRKELGSVVLSGEKYSSAVWSEKYNENLLLVVQLQRNIFLKFINSTSCIGSIIDHQGEITHVNEEFLWNEIGHP